MNEMVFLQDMAIVMVISAVTMILCRRLHLPVVLGYILAGLFIGPNTPPYSLVKDIHSIHTLATLGVIFLLFAIGLEFSIRKLLKIGAVAFVASTVEIVAMLWIGFSLGKVMGWTDMDSLFLGAILSISSTTIIVKILMENKKLQEKFAQTILGILVVEDLWAIVIIALLSGIAATGSFTLSAVSFSMAKVFIFIIAILAFGFFAVPRLLNYIERFDHQEMMTIVVLGLCFGVSLIAAKVGFSIALGAFLIGAVIAETKQAHALVNSMTPIRDMFTAIFFVSIGMLIDPAVIAQYWLPILLITLVTIIGKIISCSLATFLTGYDSQTALKVGLGLAQIGEFSFIIAQLGLDKNVTSHFLYPIAVAVSALTTITTPFLMNHSGTIIEQIKLRVPKPMVTLIHFYPTWIAQISRSIPAQSADKGLIAGLKKHVVKFLFYLISVIAGFLIASKYRYVLSQLDDTAYWSIVSLVLFPLLIGFIYTVDKMIWEGIFLSLLKANRAVYRVKETKEFVHNAIRFIIVLVSGLMLIMIASFFIPTVSLTLFMFLFLLVTGGYLWKSTRVIHEHIEKTVLSVIGTEKADNAHAKTTHDQVVELIRSNYPLSFETHDLVISFNPSAVNQTIKELDLRFKTGASIVGIYRDEQAIPNPSATERLLPGDVVVIIGTHEQVLAGMNYLQQRMKEPPSS